MGAEPDRAMWNKAHKLYVQAFQEPATDAEKKRLAKLLKRPLRQDVADALFDYEAFLRGLGRMSLSTSLSSLLPASLTFFPHLVVPIHLLHVHTAQTSKLMAASMCSILT